MRNDTRNLTRPSFVPSDDSQLMIREPLSPEVERKAARVVALHSTSNEDCLELLTMLGLTPDSDGVGSYYTEVRSI